MRILSEPKLLDERSKVALQHKDKFKSKLSTVFLLGRHHERT